MGPPRCNPSAIQAGIFIVVISVLIAWILVLGLACKYQVSKGRSMLSGQGIKDPAKWSKIFVVSSANHGYFCN
jgi:hypothetical protein